MPPIPSSTSDSSLSKAPFGNMRRSFTVPTNLPGRSFPGEASKSPDSSNKVTTLFQHPSVRIVKFSPLIHASVEQRLRRKPIEPGSLPWASRPEKPLAFGDLELYKLPNEVSFLRVKAFSIPILKKTQCWCVDGESKFVIPIQDSSYCRIELPTSTEDYKVKIEGFKLALASILLYEKTVCPFKRGFTVELPPEPETPIKQVPWKPKHLPSRHENNSSPSPDRHSTTPVAEKPNSKEQPSIETLDGSKDDINTEDRPATPVDETQFNVSRADEPVVKPNQVTNLVQSLELAISSSPPVSENANNAKVEAVEVQEVKPSPLLPSPMPDPDPFKDAIKETQVEPESQNTFRDKIAKIELESKQSPTSETRSINEALEDSSSDEYLTARSHSSSFSTPDDEFESDATDDTSGTIQKAEEFPQTPTKLQNPTRSITLPSSLAPRLKPGAHHSQTPEAPVFASAIEHFQSFHSPMTPLPPSPPDSASGSPAEDIKDKRLFVPKRPARIQDESEATVADLSPGLWDMRDTKENQTIEPESQPQPEGEEDAPAKTDDSESDPEIVEAKLNRTELTRSRPPVSGRHITASIIQTTWAILNSPPSHLVQLMLAVARRIANGGLRGSLTSQSQSGESVTCSWDYTDADAVPAEAADWGEDDYGVPIRSPSRREARRRTMREELTEGWEID